MADDTVVFLLGYELGFPLGDLLYSETWPPVIFQLVLDIPPGSKLGFPYLVVSTSQATLLVPTLGYC